MEFQVSINVDSFDVDACGTEIARVLRRVANGVDGTGRVRLAESIGDHAGGITLRDSNGNTCASAILHTFDECVHCLQTLDVDMSTGRYVACDCGGSDSDA